MRPKNALFHGFPLIIRAHNPIMMRAEQGGLDLARLDSPKRILLGKGHAVAAHDPTANNDRVNDPVGSCPRLKRLRVAIALKSSSRGTSAGRSS